MWSALSHPVGSGRATAGYLQDSYVAARSAVSEFTSGGARATAQRLLQFAKDEILPRFNPRNYRRNGWDVDFAGQRVQGTAKIGRLDWQPNSDGATRTIEEATEIARANGVEIPENVKFFAMPESKFSNGVYAEYGGVSTESLENNMVVWQNLHHPSNGKIPVRIRQDVLSSDEAIVEIFGHEMHEINGLNAIFEELGGEMPIRKYAGLIDATSGGTLHNEAIDVSRQLVLGMRKKGGR